MLPFQEVDVSLCVVFIGVDISDRVKVKALMSLIEFEFSWIGVFVHHSVVILKLLLVV